MTKTVKIVYIVYRKEGEVDMVFKEEAYKEVFPDVVVAPAVPKQESMISDDQEDAKTVEEPKQAQVPVEEPKQETMQPEQEEGKE